MKLSQHSLSAFLVLSAVSTGGVHAKTKTSLDSTRQNKRRLSSKAGKGKGLITKEFFEDNPAEPFPFPLSTIECDVKLTEDIDCSGISGSEACLDLASGATLDCDGYTIRGPGPDGTGPSTVGIRTNTISDGDTTTIKNCNIEGFDFCVFVHDSNDTGGTFAPPGVPIFYRENNGSSPSGTCEGFGFGASDQQCCPYKDAIDGMTLIESTKASGCFYGYITSLATVEFFDVIATENYRGFQFQICSDISLEEIYACANENADIHYNDAWQNSDYISAAAGTIRADVVNKNNLGGGPEPETKINGFLSPDAIQSCYVEDVCGDTLI
jgi:hypothetical protein